MSDNNELISIIVPIYNVQKYLDRCMKTLLNQTYRNIEIILVDDGSTDSSGDICDEYAQIDARIKVIHKENGGLSSARNAGLDVCTSGGELIAFVDSDDWVDSTMYEEMYEKAEKEDADIAGKGSQQSVCGQKSVWQYFLQLQHCGLTHGIRRSVRQV